MRTQQSVFIATSVDGFIARKNGRIDWLDAFNATVPKGEDCGYGQFISSVDVLVMGRHSYEQVLKFDPWPYQNLHLHVLTTQKIQIPAALSNTVSFSSETPEELVTRFSNEGAKHLYIDGGITIQRFLRAGLINTLTITLIPVLLGEGKPLFSILDNDVKLKLINSISYEFGVVQNTYEILT